MGRQQTVRHTSAPSGRCPGRWPSLSPIACQLFLGPSHSQGFPPRASLPPLPKRPVSTAPHLHQTQHSIHTNWQLRMSCFEDFLEAAGSPEKLGSSGTIRVCLIFCHEREDGTSMVCWRAAAMASLKKRTSSIVCPSSQQTCA